MFWSPLVNEVMTVSRFTNPSQLLTSTRFSTWYVYADKSHLRTERDTLSLLHVALRNVADRAHLSVGRRQRPPQ